MRTDVQLTLDTPKGTIKLGVVAGSDPPRFVMDLTADGEHEQHVLPPEYADRMKRALTDLMTVCEEVAEAIDDGDEVTT